MGPKVTSKSGSDKGPISPLLLSFAGHFSLPSDPRPDTIILTTLLCAARLFESTACV